MVKLGLIDRIFRHLEKHKKITIAAGLAALVLAFILQRPLQGLVDQHALFIKLLAVVLGPVATVLGFYLGYKSKRELIDHTKISEATLASSSKESLAKLVTLSERLNEKSEEIGKLTTNLEVSRRDLENSQKELKEKEASLSIEAIRVRTLDTNLRRVTGGGHNLWQAYPPRPFPEYYEWLRAPRGAKIVTIGNLKGGVGKTTIAANLAAYVSQRREKPVLLIDLDYQGSLSNMMMFAAGMEDVPSNVNTLFEKDATLETLDKATVHLAKILPRGWVVPASYTLGEVEGSLLLKWLMEPDQKLDARYILARFLLNPSVRSRYSLIILDMPPRLTLGAVGALIASHHLIVPAALDKMSAEAVLQFLNVTNAIKNDMSLDLDLLGAVGTLSRFDTLRPNEALAWTRIGEHCNSVWGHERDYRFSRTIPRKDKIAEAAGEAVAYLADGAGGNGVRQIFNALGDEVWDRIFGTPHLDAGTQSSPQSSPSSDIDTAKESN